jgi:membrane protease YdiL (CAAX protease family)
LRRPGAAARRERAALHGPNPMLPADMEASPPAAMMVTEATAAAATAVRATELADAATPFARHRHLLFAAVALFVLFYIVEERFQLAALYGATGPWSGVETLLYDTILLLPIAGLAWLAFAVFDTHSGVTLIGRRWNFGWEPWVVYVVLVGDQIVASRVAAPEAVAEIAQALEPFYDAPIGRMAWGMLFAATLFGVLTEEIVFRGLLQRALEGYMRAGYANVVQALVFGWAHFYVYGYPFHWGIYIVWGLVLGTAFQRTRSLMAPVMLHATNNMIHAIAFSAALK